VSWTRNHAKVTPTGAAYDAKLSKVKGITGVADQTADDVPFVAKTNGSEAQVRLEVVQIDTADVAQFDVLEVRPEALVRIEIGGIASYLLEAHKLGCSSLGREAHTLGCEANG
jgi:hypothetical protein